MNPIAVVLLILLVLLLVGALPAWPHSQAWWGGGYGVPGIFVILLIVLLVLAATGHL